MALVLDDRVKETSTTTGTGTLNLSGAVSGFQTFVAGVGDGNTTYYAIVNRDADEWEVGLGTVTDSSTDTLSRSAITSSNSDSAVDFSAGTKDVFVTLPASKVANLDTNNNLTIGAGSAGVDYTLTFDGADSDGVITWMEDEDYFKFSDDILINSTEKIQFYDTGLYIYSSTDGQLDIVADTEVQIAATTIDINGAVALNGAITGATNITLSGELDAATLDISGNADIDGTLEADAITINGTAIGSIYGAVAGSSSIVTTGALDSGSITSGFGTIDTGSSAITTTGLISGGSLDIDDVLINGTTIGHTDDTDLITVADGIATIAGEISVTTLDIGGTNITATAAEINLIDGGTSRGTTAVASGDGILINDGGTMRMTNVDTVSTYFASHSVGGSNIVTTGALNSGSITSGFGTIDTGSSTITTTGLITGGSLDIDNVLINGTTIGHTDDTDLMTVADGLLTVAGEISVTTLDIGGTNVTSTAAELNILDGVTATTAELNYNDIATLGTTAASKTFTADANNLTKITGGVYLEEATLTFDATQDWDVRASPVAKVTLTNNVTFDAPTNPTTGQYISIVCIQDGTGSRTIAWNAVFEFKDDTAPTATTTASKGDMFTFRYNGAKWLEVGRNLNLTLS